MNYERTDVMEAEQPMTTADLAKGNIVNGTPADHQIDGGTRQMPLFPENELADFRQRWKDVQVGFVDDPRNAVKRADEQVAALMTRLAQVFSEERNKLEHEWDKGENVSTEDLRVALQRYRSFFDRLLSV